MPIIPDATTSDSPSNFSKAFKINFIILLLVMVVMFVLELVYGSSGDWQGIAYAIIMMYYCGICFAGNLILALIFFLVKKRNAAKGCLLSAFGVTIVAIGACFGGLYVIPLVT
ncbi:MAG TPA: hypothetical protein VK158_06440 [Acidobacteriota bacterium]|nr:hypothetical protein [Acidobacteriota bacterium]